jgi:type IV pilus assembly protein PilP
MLGGHSDGVWASTNDATRTAAEGVTKQAEDKPSQEFNVLLQSAFDYQRGNRPDPFVPFISERAIEEQGDKEEEMLSGMRLFEPGQLNLVAITIGGSAPVALVQDSTGKGYIIKEGLAIGRRGVIKSIMPNIVIIEESFQNIAGQERKRTIEMVLRKEGDK